MLQNDIEFLARADMIKRNIDKKSGMVSMIPIRISLIEECAANEVTEIRVPIGNVESLTAFVATRLSVTVGRGHNPVLLSSTSNTKGSNIRIKRWIFVEFLSPILFHFLLVNVLFVPLQIKI
jgi:hypothetical protein